MSNSRLPDDSSVSSEDKTFLNTFPHIVSVREDEWLLGLMLRCDEANDWPGGTTADYVCTATTGVGSLARPALFVSAAVFDLQMLADCLALSLSEIERTCFRQSLERLVGQRRRTSTALTLGLSFRVCPICVEEDRLLGRFLALPHVRNCPRHGVVLRDACDCGTRLRPFRRGFPVFRCGSCMKPWEELKRDPANRMAIESDVAHLDLYEVFLSHGSKEVVARAVDLIRSGQHNRAKYAGTLTTPSTIDNRDWRTGGVGTRSSLAVIVSLLVRLGIAPERLLIPQFAVYQERRYYREDGRPTCPNRACPLFGVEGGVNVVHLAKYKGAVEYCCKECGSTFYNGRLVTTFDMEHGAPNLRNVMVERALAQLYRWKCRLAEACELMLVVDEEPITVERAFAKAGIPTSWNWRARRLGLAQMVETYADEQTRRGSTALGEGENGWSVSRIPDRRRAFDGEGGTRAKAEDERSNRHLPASVEQRKVMFRVYEETGSVSTAVAAAGVSPKTFASWRRRFELGGYPALEKSGRQAPHGFSKRLPESIREEIQLCKEEHPEWGKERIAAEISERHGWQLVVSGSGVRRVLIEAGLWQGTKVLARR